MQKAGKIHSGFFVSFDNTRIYYEIYGSKDFQKPMIFLHGLGGNVTAWQPQIDHFVHLGYTVIAVDLRGHGLSGRPEKISSYAIKKTAEDMYTLITLLQLQHVTLVGQCLGGLVALQLAGTFQITLSSLVLISAVDTIPWYFSLLGKSHVLSAMYILSKKLHATWRKEGHMAVDKYRGTGDINLRRFLGDISYMSIPSYIATCQSIFTFQGKHLLKHITCPTLLIHGTNDTFFPKHLAHQLHKHIKNSHLVFIPKGNHILLLNNPEELNQIIEIHLKSLQSQKDNQTLIQRTFSAE